MPKPAPAEIEIEIDIIPTGTCPDGCPCAYCREWVRGDALIAHQERVQRARTHRVATHR